MALFQVIFQSLCEELSKLETNFSNHVLDATKDYQLILTNKSDVEGIPDGYLELFAQNHNSWEKKSKDATKEDGPWLVSLDGPSFIPFMEYCKHSSLRKKLYLAFVTRASSGQYDNTSNIYKIVNHISSSSFIDI